MRVHQPVTAGYSGMSGGAEGDRTPDLRIANATLSQLSYGPLFMRGSAPSGTLPEAVTPAG